MIVELIYIVCGIAVLIASLGIARFGEGSNIVYARLHVSGVFDVACMLAMIASGQFYIAFAYFLLTPIVAHTIANARYFRSEK